MKVLLINKFLYPKGGDAICTLATGKLLAQKGHEVYYWGMNHPQNPQYPYKEHFISEVDYHKQNGLASQLKLSLNILYSWEAKRKFSKFLQETGKPDIVHLNNFAHQISPSILDMLEKYKIPSVMTMHDYKLVCPAHAVLVNGKPCEKCKGGKYYFCLLNKCTKGSSLKSLVNTVEMYLHHRLLHIYDQIDLYISPSQFLLNKVKEMGFKKEVVYLPNFVEIDRLSPSYTYKEESLIYAGRLSKEKGIVTLIEAVRGTGLKLKIIGEGPLKEDLLAKVEHKSIRNVEFLGYMKSAELFKEVQKAMFTVLPSECYENNPRTLIESFALGKPAIGARIGGIPELVRDGQTGYTFESGNGEDLREKIKLLAGNKDKITEMGKNARLLVEKEFNSERHYESLLAIYRRAMGSKEAG